MHKSIIILFLTSYVCSAYKILVAFPYPGKSHSILGEGYVKHLLNAGHEVTYVTGVLMKNPHKNLRQIDVTSNNAILDHLLTALDVEVILRTNAAIDAKGICDVTRAIANSTFHNPNVKKLLMDPNEHFDVVIAEWLYTELYSGFAAVFDCPFIWSSSMDPHSLVLSLIDDDPNPAYTSNHMSYTDPPFTFHQRVEELMTLIGLKILKWWTYDLDNKVFNDGFREAVEKRGRKLPSLYEFQYTGAMMLGNSHVSSGRAVRLPQNYKSIAGYHMDQTVKPLPENLQKIMDEANHGVIYFSMGTMVKSKTMSNEMKKSLLQMFSGLKQTVIWKLEEPLANSPKNLHIVEWAPQQSILAHPNCILFITHGGLLSTTEAIHFGVPIIGIPIFADQFMNVYRATTKGFAKQVSINDDVAVNLKLAIEEVLENPKYREKVKELSFIHHHRPRSPSSELVHWVEHVVRTRGAPHLRSPALDLPFYKKMYLDLLALILAILFVLKKIIERFCCSKKNDNKKKKTN